MKERKSKKFGLLNLVALIVLVVVLSVVPTLVVVKEKNKAIEENFFGELSEFSGVLTIWNIDSFEGGTGSKQSYLESVARLFERRFKKTYVHVMTYSPEGLVLALQEGKLPDMFSFGSGVGELILDKIHTLDLNLNILPVYESSGMLSGQQKAVPYTTGGYALFSTQENLTKAGQPDDANLINIVDSASYEKTFRSKTKVIPSTTYGTNGLVLPESALYHTTNQKTDLVSMGSTYDAYVGYVGYESSTILLGNHRDLGRLTNKLRLSQISSLVAQPLGGYTDLVQYLSICSSTTDVRHKISNEFIKFCLQPEQQRLLTEIGMFSVLDLLLYEGKDYYSEFENALKKELIVPSVFRTSNEREQELIKIKK